MNEKENSINQVERWRHLSEAPETLWNRIQCLTTGKKISLVSCAAKIQVRRK